MATDKPQFARTCLWVFAGHVAVIALVLTDPIGCSRKSADGRTLASERSLFEEAVPHQLNLALSGTKDVGVAGQVSVEIADPPSRLVLPETRAAPTRVDPEPTHVETPTRQIVEDAVSPKAEPPSRPETPKTETPQREPVKSEGKSETPKPKPQRTRKPDRALPEKAESGKTPSSSNPAPAPKPAASKPKNEAKPDKAAEKRPPQARTVPVPTKNEADPEPPAVTAKVIDEPETVRARPVAVAEQDKEILQAKPVLPATVVKEPLSEGSSDESGRGESPAAGANMGAYQATVQRMIRSRWNEPKGEPAAQMPEVLITISRDGSIVYSRLQRSSGNDVLDRSAMEAVRPRSRLPPLPAGYPDERYDLVIKFQLD